MAARIEHLEQRLAAMANSGARASISHEVEDFSYLASAAQVEAAVEVTRGAACALEPRGTTVELDPQRDEGERQAMLPQSFQLSEVGKTLSMIATPPSDPVVRTKSSTSHVVGAETSSSAAMQMVTSVMRSPLFSTTELMPVGFDVARVFCVAATLCERGSVTATSAEIREGIVGEQPSTHTLRDETTWQAATPGMELLPARSTIDRERIVPYVCMMDNQSSLFCLVNSTRQVYVRSRILLDSGAQSLMLGKAACISLGVW
ncbi:hypothetical protein Mp_1g20910 [Marchantia polymorpha subsp. ruderalis]|uniref:Uncharacterized protein n=2 Tax=Marchantia polymorpha TaxID=3197 RepID=A0AAF6ASG2_MARPO|nr:hypothetical protein MARPO_0001s0426 [Marchantia polymorpha]BBM99382.1 hypothetical protein Mp_1g20910 [Marchantia polymorpha subsp. ruderalis]|eukprot:PTQ50463.1 hypothetical protein MARPO_0001s0426 [Marchantia polymorpha]